MPGGLHPPIEVIASWPLNYTTYETRGFHIVIIVAVLLGLAYVAVALRVYGRIFISKNFGIDDGIIIANMIPLTGTAVGVILAIQRYGFNRHVWNIPTPLLIEARKITLATEGMYMVSTCMTKISILLFYHRLVRGTISTAFLRCVYAAIAFVAIYFFIFFFMLFGICRPLSTYWNQADWVWYMQNEKTWNCLPEDRMLIATAVISATQDFIACGLPTILLWKLKMPVRQKIALASVFAVGFFLSVCAVLRTVYIIRIYYSTYDMTWEAQSAWLWLSIETLVAPVCASAPALKVFLKKLLDVTIKSRTSSANSSANRTQRAIPPSRYGINQKIEFSVNSEQRLDQYGYGYEEEEEDIVYDRYGQKVSKKDSTVEMRDTSHLKRYGQYDGKYGYDRYGQKVEYDVKALGGTFFDEHDSQDETLYSPVDPKREERYHY